jgi:hypothetical protein
MSAHDVVKELQRRIIEIEDTSRSRPRAPRSDPREGPRLTDVALLDGLVPGRGLSASATVEVIGGPSSGKIGLGFRWLATITSAGALAVWLDLPRTFYPPAAERTGVVLSRLLVVSPANERDAANAAAAALGSGVFEAVVADWGPAHSALSDPSARRLCQRARDGHTAFYLLTTGADAQLGPRADVRLRQAQQVGGGFCVERMRPPSLGAAPWIDVGSVLRFSTAPCVDPTWERGP